MPKLRCVDVTFEFDFSKRWLVIERKRAGRYGGYTWLQESEFRTMGVLADEWGGFYLGTGKISMYSLI
jgi:hypothetical protein